MTFFRIFTKTNLKLVGMRFEIKIKKAVLSLALKDLYQLRLLRMKVMEF
jgi:hypothetical protein